MCINGKLQKSLLIKLQTLVYKTNAKVVLSSNWRLYSNYKKHIIEVLSTYQIDVIDCTCSRMDLRPLEIFLWVEEYRPDMCIVLDDRPLRYEKNGSMLGDCCIQTNTQQGLTDSNVYWGTHVLNSYQAQVAFNSIHLNKKSRLRRSNTNIVKLPLLVSK